MAEEYSHIRLGVAHHLKLGNQLEDDEVTPVIQKLFPYLGDFVVGRNRFSCWQAVRFTWLEEHQQEFYHHQQVSTIVILVMWATLYKRNGAMQWHSFQIQHMHTRALDLVESPRNNYLVFELCKHEEGG